MKLPWPRSRPRLSIVLVIHRMPVQAQRTLHSLSTDYQGGVGADEYEIIVVENHSAELLGRERALSYGSNVHYHHRYESLRSPVNAINYGAAQARGTHLAVMIDGARMLTPGVVRLSLEASCIARHAAVAVPGYHLGHKAQQESVNEGYDEAAESLLLGQIDWPRDGYRLFEISVLSGSCLDGFFRPLGESNFLATSLERWRAIGGMDPRYDDYGGGYANVAMYKRLLEYPDTPCYLLYAEGTFHQFHGGVTTGTRGEELLRLNRLIEAQDAAIRGSDRERPAVRPTLLGAPHPAVYRFIRHSLDQA